MTVEDDPTDGGIAKLFEANILEGPWCAPARPMSSLTLDDLPPPDIARWVMRRKAQVVEGVRVGLITVEEACARYSLSVEEFHSWQQRLERHGLPGLSARSRRRNS